MTRQQPAKRRPVDALTTARRVEVEDGTSPMMDIDEVARRLATTVRHIRRLVLERRIPHYKFSGKLRFDRVEIEAWVAASRVPAQPEVGLSLAGARSTRRSSGADHAALRPVQARPRRQQAS